MIKLSYNLINLVKRAEGEAPATDSAASGAKAPKPAPMPIVPSIPATRPANYKRTMSPMASIHGHGRALGVLDHLMQQNKTADEKQVWPISGFMPKDPDFLGPHTKDIPLGAMAGTILGIPGGILYHALMNDKSSVSDYMLAALKGGLIGGGAGAVSSGVFGYPNVPPTQEQQTTAKNLADTISNVNKQ